MSRMLRAGIVAALLSAPAIVAAQSPTVHFNLAGGVTFPTGDFGQLNHAGYNIIAGIGFAQRGTPLSFRAEGIYNEFAYKCNNGFGNDNCDGNSRAGGITANAVYDLLQPNSAQPNTLYVIGGIGYYSTAQAFVSGVTNVGYNIGAGFRFPLSGFSPYLEIRYHTVSNAGVTFFPISFGLLF